MGQITIRQTSVDLPVFDEEVDLEPVSWLGAKSGLVSDFRFGPATVRALDLADVRLLHGKIRALRAGRASITAVRVDSVEFTGCDLSSVRWTGGRISRVRFDGCKLVGARFEAMIAEHVVFTGCTLREAEFSGCELAGSLFDDCDLRLTGFGPGRYRSCDLRGNDLSALTGAPHLKHVIIDHVQTIQLGEALAAELDVTFGDDVPGHL